MAPPTVLDDHVQFRLPDPEGAWTAVRLDCDAAIAGSRTFSRVDGTWELRVPRPAVQRMEYRLTLTAPSGARTTVIDPGNPRTVATAFGDRSIMEMPGYAAPAWLRAPVADGSSRSFEIRGATPQPLPLRVWSPADREDREPLPMLVVHDGPEYDAFAAITTYSAALISAGRLPAHRVVLAAPVRRNIWYSASPTYLRLFQHALHDLGKRCAVDAPVVVMGASLGGLTSLLAGLRAGPGVGGVFAQSGSFFQTGHDDQESAFRYFGRIARAVRAVLDARHTEHPLRVGLTCGTLEENLRNNEDMAAALCRAGHDVSFAAVPDLHNYTAWRDALDPALTDLLQKCWFAQG